MVFATLRRYAKRLRELMHAIWHLPGALRARGGGRDLLRGLVRAGGVRRACGVLIDYTSLSPGEQFRRYRRWIEVAEAGREEHPVKVALAVSLCGLDDDERSFAIANLTETARSTTVFVEVEPAFADSLADLRARGVYAHPMATLTGEDALPPDALGIVFLGRACCLHAQSLGAITRALETGADVVYGDSDRIDTRGVRRLPSFKPDFSPDLLFHQDYLSDCVGMTRRTWSGQWCFQNPYGSVLRAVQGASAPQPVPSAPPVARPRSSPMDQPPPVAGAPRRRLFHGSWIEHLPVVLSHRLARAEKPPSAPLECLENLLRSRYGPCARVETTSSGWHCRFGTEGQAHVTVVIPTRDRLDLLAPCVDSLYETNTESCFDVIVVDNGSRLPETRDWLRRMELERENFRVLRADMEFNWSRLNNLALAEATGDVLVFLNNDTVSVTEGWLARMAEYATRDDVGVVGPLLLFEDGTIQHAGVVVGYGGRTGHVYSGVRPEETTGIFVSPMVSRNVATVTGACLAVGRDVIDAIGVFNEAYRIVGSDTEFCLRAHLAGLGNVYLPEVVLLHHESQSRSRSDPPSDNDLLERFIAEHIPQDPFYNPNLTLSSLHPSLSAEPRVPADG